MNVNDPLPARRASLEVLRAEASQELETVVHERLLGGEDPWNFMDDLPTIDQLVVYLLRSEAITANGGQHPSPAREYRVLRQIALQHPQLTTTVWQILGRDSSTFAWQTGAGIDPPEGSNDVGEWGSGSRSGAGSRSGSRLSDYD